MISQHQKKIKLKINHVGGTGGRLRTGDGGRGRGSTGMLLSFSNLGNRTAGKEKEK